MIYFIQDTSSGAIKIGYSKRPSARLSDLQIAHSSKLVLLALMDGGPEEEHHLHCLFSRITGEWFHPTAELLDYILAHGTVLDVPQRPREPIQQVVIKRPRRKAKDLHLMSKEQNRQYAALLSDAGLDQLSDEELIDFLATTEDASGNYRFHESEILRIVKGNPAAILEQIHAVREGRRTGLQDRIFTQLQRIRSRIGL